MKSLFITLMVVMSLVLVPSAFAEQPTFTGEVSLKGLFEDVNGNKAKFNEYRDLHDGAYGRIKLLYDTDAWFLKADVSDIAYDTQNYQLSGGVWGLFKADAYYRELPHNITFGARSMFTGVGSGNLTLPPNPPVDPAVSNTWPSSFDYLTERRQTGGSLSIDLAKPFFFNVSAMTEQRKGIKPAGAATLADSFPALELPEPVDYTTNILKADVGYAKKPLFLDVYFMYSDFRNKNDVLNFTNPTLAGLALPAADSLTLPPDNQYYKIGFKGAVKLPLNSKLNVNTGWSQTTSRTDLLAYDASNVTPLALSNSVFHGRVETQNLDVALTTNPVGFLDAKIFYKFYNRDNRSDVISQTDTFAQTFVNHLFDYQKNTAGGELGFRLPMKLYLSTGYTFVLTDRHLSTLADTRDDIYNAELRWKGLDFLTVRAGYERLFRKSDFSEPSLLPTDPPVNVIGARSFDLADKTRDSLKASFDFYPVDFMSIGVGYKHKETNYKHLDFGLKSDRREEVFTNADLKIGKYAELFAHFDYELTRRSQDQSSLGASWNLKDREKYYDFGVGANIFIIPKKLTLRAQYDYTKSDGNADFTLSSAALAGLPVGANNSNVDIPNWDSYTKQTFLVKLSYYVTKNITLAIGYAYETFKYSDAQLDGYVLIPTTLGSTDAYLTGAFRNQSYNASLYFTTLSYKF